jgi:hypothetical protein
MEKYVLLDHTSILYVAYPINSLKEIEKGSFFLFFLCSFFKQFIPQDSNIDEMVVYVIFRGFG